MKLTKIFRAAILPAAGALGLLALAACNNTLAPEEYPPDKVQELCGRGYAAEGFEFPAQERPDRAWKPDKWMDSLTYCALKTSPESVAGFKTALLGLNGRSVDGQAVTVAHTPPDCKGDEFECLRYGQLTGDKTPGWWPGAGLPGLEWFSVDRGGRGVDYVILEPEGLIFARIWRN
jgi:hypothetical protein